MSKPTPNSPIQPRLNPILIKAYTEEQWGAIRSALHMVEEVIKARDYISAANARGEATDVSREILQDYSRRATNILEKAGLEELAYNRGISRDSEQLHPLLTGLLKFREGSGISH